MSTSDPTLIRQLHVDRTARLSGGRRFHLPSLPIARFSRRERRQLTVRAATGC